MTPSCLLSSSRRRAHATDDRGNRVGSQGPRHCGHLPDPSWVEHMEQTMWLNDALHPGTGLRCCMSISVMQMQHSLETSTPPTRQCGSPQATKLGNKVSGVTLAYSFKCSHTYIGQNILGSARVVILLSQVARLWVSVWFDHDWFEFSTTLSILWRYLERFKRQFREGVHCH